MSNYSDLLSRIVIDASKPCHRQPCIKGHPIWVSSILSELAEGVTVEEILYEYPNLEREDILACFAYAAEMTQDINKVVGTVVEIEKGAILEYQSRD